MPSGASDANRYQRVVCAALSLRANESSGRPRLSRRGSAIANPRLARASTSPSHLRAKRAVSARSVRQNVCQTLGRREPMPRSTCIAVAACSFSPKSPPTSALPRDLWVTVSPLFVALRLAIPVWGTSSREVKIPLG